MKILSEYQVRVHRFGVSSLIHRHARVKAMCVRHPPILSTHATPHNLKAPSRERERVAQALCSSFIQNITTHHTVHEAKLHPHPFQPTHGGWKISKAPCFSAYHRKAEFTRQNAVVLESGSRSQTRLSRISFFGEKHIGEIVLRSRPALKATRVAL